MQSFKSALDVVLAVTPDLEGMHVLDVGCGGGEFARQLEARGARVAGIDPEPSAVARAGNLVPRANFMVGQAESLPFGDKTFDLLVTVNALHHVPVAVMAKALDEARRVVKPEGRVIVIEPETRGSFFDALRPVEDETAVRQAAQVALRAAVERQCFRVEKLYSYTRREVFADVAAFIERMVAVDPGRRAAAQARHGDVAAAIAAAARRTADGQLELEQPILAAALQPVA